MNRRVFILWWVAGSLANAYALTPGKALTQYSVTVWTEQAGLPQDSINAIAQTTDGFLWLGTDEGLARFDGYEFITFDRDKGQLPSNSVTALAAGRDGSLWIGTPNGLTRSYQGRFHNFTQKDGMPGEVVSALFVDHAGMVWIVTGGSLSRFDGAVFTNFLRDRDIPARTARSVFEDSNHTLYAAGVNWAVRFVNGRFQYIFGPSDLAGDFPRQILADRHGNLWVLGVHGLVRRSPEGRVSRYGSREGLSDSFGLSSMMEDRDGNLWVATDGGLARLERGRFRTLAAGEKLGVRCVFEDREGLLWVGTNRGLLRLRDDVFSVFGKSEGLPSDEPNVVYQDHSGRIWAGFLDVGLQTFPFGHLAHSEAMGSGQGRVYSIRETRSGQLLVSERDGLSIWNKESVRSFVPPDPAGRKRVYDALEDAAGNIWLALPNGLGELHDGVFRTVISAASPVMIEGAFVTLTEGVDGSLWAGTISGGLWHVGRGGNRLYTTADGLGSNQIRSLFQDADGTLWIGTLGGGLSAFREDRFLRFTARDGLLSDNVVNILDDNNALWLSTTRGICRISKKQLMDFADQRRKHLDPTNYGLADGLRSAQAAPEIGAVASRNANGSLWFATARGIAVYQPKARARAKTPARPYLVEMTADGRRFGGESQPRIPPGLGRVEIRYAAIYLSAPERVRYSYQLEGLDSEWVAAGSRRVVTYNSLRHGHYRFRVRAEAPDGSPVETSYSFDLLPHAYETGWFRLLYAAVGALLCWMAYQLRIHQIRLRFAAILKERLRLAREIHDTLAQAFVGISSQLDALETCLPEDLRPAHIYLELARRMAQHSLTEARRSVMDLRSAALENHDLSAALKSGVRSWAVGSPASVEVDVTGRFESLPEDLEQNLLRIAQEAVINAQKHSRASRIAVKLEREDKTLKLRVEDDGCGFELDDAFAEMGGHFGLIGIRERAERIGGELRLESCPGRGTEVEVTVPLP